MSTSIAARNLLRANVNKTAKLASAMVVPNRGIAGKVMRDRSLAKPAPFDYKNKEFKKWQNPFDRTTLRFDENSKLVIVEGAYGIGKTKFCQELAEELEMKYEPEANMDYWYINYYGEDLRELNEFLMPRNKSYDEKDFMRDPTGPVPGSADRLLMKLFVAKFDQYYDAIRHIFNTGQGVILEKSPYSHYAIVNAAYNAGYITRETKTFYGMLLNQSLRALKRPNLIIYLDAPIDVVQRKIKARGHEWDKNSPVLANPQFNTDIANELKNVYLKEAKDHSQVVVYDWSEPVGTEDVVEDLEALNFDYYGAYDTQQADWRLHNETEATLTRVEYSSMEKYMEVINNATNIRNYDNEHMFRTAEEMANWNDVFKFTRGNRYAPGYNTFMGESVLFKANDYYAEWYGKNWTFGSDPISKYAPFWNLKSSPADGSKPLPTSD